MEECLGSTKSDGGGTVSIGAADAAFGTDAKVTTRGRETRIRTRAIGTLIKTK